VISLELDKLKRKIPQIFEKVRMDVKKITGRQRAGLSLGLVEMGIHQGGFIGGIHFPPGTDIVINKTALKILLEQSPEEIIYAYTYHILLHEYIHSLGIYDEQQCRAVTLSITEKIYNDINHPALILAKKGIGVFFPDLHLIHHPPQQRYEEMIIEYIAGFDKNSYEFYS